MVSDTVYELCAPILDDGSLDEEVKIDKLQELLVKETTLGGPGLENTVLDILWRHREEAESRTDQVAKSTPKSRYQTIRRSSPAPWGSGRPTTPSTGSPGLGTSPARAPLPVPPPSLNRGRSYNTAVNANSPLGSPRSSFGVPYVSQRPSFNRFDSSPEFASIHRRDSQFTNSDGDWMTKTVDGGDEDDYEEGPINLSAYSGVGALPYDMLRSVAGEQLTDEDLEVALESHGYDLAAALHALSGTVTTESRSAQAGLDSYTPHSLIGKSMRVKAPPFPRPVTPSARSRQGIICKYFLSTGSCLRDDCRFSHDPSKHICKYWMSGSCLAGDSCMFSHDPTLAMEQMSLGQQVVSPGSKLNPNVSSFTYFPSLPAPSTRDQSSLQSSIPRHAAEASEFVPSNPSESGSPRIEARLRLSGNASAFQPRSRIESQPASGGRDNKVVDEFPSLAAAAAARRARNSRRGSQNATSKPRNLADIVRTSTADDSSNPHQKTESHGGHTIRASGHIPAPSRIPWLDTGSEANRAYLSARAEAIKHATVRNRFLQSAAQAWNRNDARSAKALSMRGQAENESMKRLHREAAEELYLSRNAHRRIDTLPANSALYRSDEDTDSRDETFIDLHGLHTDEAIEYVEKCLFENHESSRPVYIITGTGHHSRNSREKLGRSVKGWLESWGYAFREFSVPGDRNAAGGILGVDPSSFDKSRRTLGERAVEEENELSGYLGEGKIRIVKERPPAFKR